MFPQCSTKLLIVISALLSEIYWFVTSVPLFVTRRYIANIHNSLPPFLVFGHANDRYTASPRYVVAPDRLIIWHPLKTTFLKVFPPVNRTGEIFRVRLPKLRIIFGETLTRIETRVYQHHIPDYSSDLLAPLKGWRRGQQPSWQIDG